MAFSGRQGRTTRFTAPGRIPSAFYGSNCSQAVRTLASSCSNRGLVIQLPETLALCFDKVWVS